MPAQIAIAFARSRAGKTLVRIDSVDGMTNAAPMPITAASGDQHRRRVRERAGDRAEREHDETALQRALASEPVAERGGREEQAGEDERVRVDEPLDLRVRGAEAADVLRLCSVGSATLSTVLPMMTMTSDVQRTARIFHRRE